MLGIRVPGSAKRFVGSSIINDGHHVSKSFKTRFHQRTAQGFRMETSTLDLSNLVGNRPGTASDMITRPRSRWETRIVLPVTIFASAGGLLAFAARDALVPAIGVWVVPVLAKPIDTYSQTESSSRVAAMSKDELGPLLVQAPGWVEAAPYAVNVPALAEGVIKEVLVLEGDRVEAEQVVARMVDDDAKLSVREAEAELGALRADVCRTEFDLEVAEARSAEVQDALTRARELIVSGGVPRGELAQLEYRTQAAEKEKKAAKAAIEVKKASAVRQEVVIDQLRLQLSRMEIRSPIAGTVMSRLIEPGTRISMASRARAGAGTATESMSGTVMRLYDPAKLQVRAEIPLADSAKIAIGSRARITTEALPEKTLHGAVTRVVHEANIQRNTIQVKILIGDSVPALKPEMLARVRLYAAPTPDPGSLGSAGIRSESVHEAPKTEGNKAGQPGLRLVIPVDVLVNRQANSAQVWAVNILESGDTAAELRTVSLTGEISGGNIEVLQGVRLGDRLIADAPQNLADADRVRVLGEKVLGTKKEP